MEETHSMRTSSGLEYHIRGGDEALLQRIVERMENGTMTTPDGGSSLHMDAAEGKIEDCKVFPQGPLKRDINGTDDKAIHESNWETIHFLIENGADVTWSAKSGETPLHIAAGKGTKEIVGLLLSKGASLELLVKCRGKAKAQEEHGDGEAFQGY
ncbi:hypothetical protein OROHE_009487 [Orobanche hederae]